MKILHIIPNLRKGGAERLVLDICNELQKKVGVEVKLVTFSILNEYKELAKTIDWHVIPSKYIPSITGKAKINVEELQNFIDSFDPDIVHSHLWESEIVCSRLNFSNAKRIIHFHDNMEQLSRFRFSLNKRRLTNFYEKSIVMKKYKKNNTCFIVISQNTYEYAKRSLPLHLRHNIKLLHNAINYSAFYNPYRELPSQKIKLITIGSLVDKKNQMFLILVAKYLRERDIDFRLNILGDGVNKTLLQNKIDDFNLNNCVSLYGNIDNVSEYLHNSNIYVHSALYEPFGLVLLEANASGLPVITLDGGGNSDIVSNGYNGYIVENNVVIFANKIIELATNEELYSKLSGNAQEFAKQYDIKQYVDKLLDICTKC